MGTLVCPCEYVYMSTGAFGVEKWMLVPLELQMQVVGHVICVSGMELGSSVRVSCALNHRALSSQ